MTGTPQQPQPVAVEADFDAAPGMLEGAMELTIGPKECDLAYWITQVAQGTLRERGVTGHHENALVPDFLKAPGPLREALVLEFGLRALSEEIATRLLAPYVEIAPSILEMEFYSTQLLDEARHARVFRNHLVELGMPEATLMQDIEEMAVEFRREVLQPVIDFTLDIVQKQRDFYGGVAVFAIVIEGVLAPAAELSERKWTPLSPATGEISRGTSIDEMRHLTVANTILRDYVRDNPAYRPRLLEILRSGVDLWDSIDDRKFVMHREELFQKGMHEHAGLIADYEIWPGTRLLDTTADQRYAMAEQWTDKMAAARLADMGLPTEVMVSTTAKAPA
ncbi:VlmB-like protein [Streptomyces sp. p1417]|uniref:VlmB-like protein n=1 Tax=Streptomyces typhae TaxID=2681492 RepID=A0A6L6X3R0_9ACTN|nr:VlmB-like protein [Streptomyces typhae]MVO88432.1 VlmB-like protein [Streptomyces typhae]